MEYCSKEMRLILDWKSGLVDLYYNDVFCLRKTVNKKENIKFFEKPKHCLSATINDDISEQKNS
jgi:hypothetical protein